MFEINQYAFLGIIVVAVVILLITILITCAIRYNIKQKYLTIRECLKNNISYQKDLKQYEEILEENGITSKKKRKRLLKILETLHK